MHGHPYKTVAAVAGRLMREQALAGKIFLAGGLVPWLVSQQGSQRLHSDVDVVAPAADMPAVRAYLHRAGLYDPALDSQLLPFNSSGVDHGLVALLDGVPVNFAPFCTVGTGIAQYNFSLAALGSFDALLRADMQHITRDDYITTRDIDGTCYGMYTLEMVRATKVRSDRDKDARDIAQIDRIGIDEARYHRVLPAVLHMQISCTTAA